MSRETPKFRDTRGWPAKSSFFLLQKSVAKVKFSRRHLRQIGAAMLVGYARVSTDDQDLTLQRAALTEAGCKRVYEEKASGAKRSSPELTRMLDQLVPAMW